MVARLVPHHYGDHQSHDFRTRGYFPMSPTVSTGRSPQKPRKWFSCCWEQRAKEGREGTPCSGFRGWWETHKRFTSRNWAIASSLRSIGRGRHGAAVWSSAYTRPALGAGGRTSLAGEKGIEVVSAFTSQMRTGRVRDTPSKFVRLASDSPG